MGASLGSAVLVSATMSIGMAGGLFVYASEADERVGAQELLAEDAPANIALVEADDDVDPADAPDRPLLPIEIADGADAPLTSIVPAPAALLDELEEDPDRIILGGQPPATTTTVPGAAPTTTIDAGGIDAGDAGDIAGPTTTVARGQIDDDDAPTTTTTTARPADQGGEGQPTTTTMLATPPTTAPTTTTTRPAEPIEEPGAGDGYRLVWADEFESFDTTSWTKEHSTYGDGNNELQCYLPENVTIVDGVLRLTATDAPAACPWETRDYGSGMVRTRDKIDWTRGRFEVRAKMPAGQGFWPAAWMSPTDSVYGRWPNSGEIDIVEALGHRTNRIIGSLHWMTNDGHRVKNREYFAETGFTGDWHTYSLTWEEGLFIWEVDGIEYHRVDTWDSAVGAGDAPFDQPFYLKLNLAVGGRAPGSPDATTPFPSHYEIDWVRVYQR